MAKLLRSSVKKQEVSEQDVVRLTHLLPVIEHSEEEHGHQQQRGLLRAQEVPAGAEKDMKTHRSSFDSLPPAAGRRRFPGEAKLAVSCLLPPQSSSKTAKGRSLCVVVDGVIADEERGVEGLRQQRVDGDHHQQHGQLQHRIQPQEDGAGDHGQDAGEHKVLRNTERQVRPC